MDTRGIEPVGRLVEDEKLGVAEQRPGQPTKPPGSLGRLEELACRLAAIRGSVPEGPLRPAVVVAAADHGVAAHGVSAYPQEVTAQMLANFAGGGAAICVLALEAGARLVVVDAGVAGAPRIPGVRVEVVDRVPRPNVNDHRLVWARCVHTLAPPARGAPQ